MCQGCVDEGDLTQATHNAIGDFRLRYPGAEFGPAHLVIGDDNVDDVSIDYCLNEAYRAPITDELIATISFLRMLRSIPEEHR